MSASGRATVRSAATCEKLNGFLPWISERIRGQPEVLAGLDAHFGRSELGLTEPGHVLGGFLFVGPTGVGKTETALLFAEYFFGPDSVARLNMAEFKEARNVLELRERLAAAKRAGKRVYLIDEIEKAHWEVLDLLLGILDKRAEAAAPDGSPMDFSDSYFVMTSNLGAREAMRSRTRNYTSFSNTVMEYVRRYLRPEFLGRIESIGSPFVFRRLEEPQQRELAGFHIERVLERVRASGHSICLGSDAFEYVMRNGFSEEYGARRLLGVIRKTVEGAVSDALRANRPTRGVLVERTDGRGLGIEAAAAIEEGRCA
jgi:ATP-dependent Clp protease ATP-binding subunit ClpC